MDYNPLAEELEDAVADLRRLRRRRSTLKTKLDKHRDFNRRAATQSITEYQTVCDNLEADQAKVKRRLAAAKKKTRGLKKKTDAGWDPTYWFSKKRKQAKKRLKRHYRELTELKQHKELLTLKLAQTRSSLTSIERNIASFDGFDNDKVATEIAALDETIPLRQLEVESLEERKCELDTRLEAPVKVLEGLETDLRKAERSRTSLSNKVADAERDIERAAGFDQALSRAGGGYERAMIHQECEEAFGVGRPRDVISERRRVVSETRREISRLDRKLAALRRDVTKAQERLAKVAARGSRVVRALVIDGSNVCYQSGTFIGLVALSPLCRRLLVSYEVTVVFDASIRHRLESISDVALRNSLPGSTVHVVASRTQADETILAAAEDPFVYVLSNDRFSEYRDKPAVRDGSPIRHEIINGRVLVHDLELAVPFG